MKSRIPILFRKISLAIGVILLVSSPLWGVFKEKDLSKTLSVLHYELRNAYLDMVKSSEGNIENEGKQHQQLVSLIESCNEISVMLYSQPQDFTFDLTYALDEASRQYTSFQSNRLPYDDIVSHIEIETDRYEKLVSTLKNLPPTVRKKKSDDDLPIVIESVSPDDSTKVSLDTILVLPAFMEDEYNPYELDSAGQAERDSCLYYAEKILDQYWEMLFRVDEDNEYYTETDAHLKAAYTYAQDRYKSVQKKIFIEGQTPYHEVLSAFGTFKDQAVKDCLTKYSNPNDSTVKSQWRGDSVMWFVLGAFLYIFAAALVGFLLFRVAQFIFPSLKKEKVKESSLIIVLLLSIAIYTLTIFALGFATDSNFLKMARGLLFQYAWTLAAIFITMAIRLEGDEVKNALLVYLPIILITFIVISFRIIFIPNSLVQVIFPPILILFTIWQLWADLRKMGCLPKYDQVYMWISFVVLFASSVIAWLGYNMLALVVIIWWEFQLTMILTINAVSDLLNRYYRSIIARRLKNYRAENPYLPIRGKASYIEVSWLYDMLRMVVIPIIAVLTVPFSIFMAGRVFDLADIMLEYFSTPFINVEKVVRLSGKMLAIVVSLFFVTRYLAYAIKALYRTMKTKAAIAKLPNGKMFKETDINFNLADNIITLLCWGVYAVVAFVLMKIPTSAITIISTGLATGIGFALKDVLNNFFYGIQLMSGRLRVGDVIECDGVRGRVESMTYQSTQIIAGDGSVMAFPNSSLFSKNFKNLTRNHAYELLQIPVGIKYGSDIEKVRKLLIDALQVLCVKDEYGRDVVDPENGIIVRFQGFGDNSVDLIVQQFTTVETHYSYAAAAREVIYNTLNANGIEIPFPQRDVYVKQVPSADDPIFPIADPKEPVNGDIEK